MKKNFVWTRIKDLFGIIRFKIAYFIAPDWIDDLEHRLSVFLCEQTGGRLSKCYYSIETMRSEANDYQQRVCDECEYYLADNEQSEDVTDINVGKKSEWISVDERLPDKYSSVLILCEGEMRIDYIDSYGSWHNNFQYRVDHWMPLPTPPKIGGSAE